MSGRPAVVRMQSWAGCNEIPVTVLGETPKRYRCRWEETSLGRSKGLIRLVPKGAVKFVEAAAAATSGRA